jgi:hypothetical protein
VFSESTPIMNFETGMSSTKRYSMCMGSFSHFIMPAWWFFGHFTRGKNLKLHFVRLWLLTKSFHLCWKLMKDTIYRLFHYFNKLKKKFYTVDCKNQVKIKEWNCLFACHKSKWCQKTFLFVLYSNFCLEIFWKVHRGVGNSLDIHIPRESFLLSSLILLFACKTVMYGL